MEGSLEIFPTCPNRISCEQKPFSFFSFNFPWVGELTLNSQIASRNFARGPQTQYENLYGAEIRSKIFLPHIR